MSPIIPSQALTMKRTLSQVRGYLEDYLNIDLFEKKKCPWRLDIVNVRKISSVEDDRLETDVRSPSSGTDGIARREDVEDPRLGHLRSSCDIARASPCLVPHMQVWRLHLVVSEGDLLFKICRRRYTSCPMEKLLQSSKNSVWMASIMITKRVVRQLQALRVMIMSKYSSCVYSIIIRSQLSPAEHFVS